MLEPELVEPKIAAVEHRGAKRADHEQNHEDSKANPESYHCSFVCEFHHYFDPG